jgi:hypothetical protein
MGVMVNGRVINGTNAQLAPSVEDKIENLREVLAVYPDLQGLRSVKLYFKGSRAVEPQDSSYIIRTPRSR